MPKNYNLFLKGRVGYWDFNADMVNYVLDKHKESEVHVLIDSLGGDVATALSISSLFNLHGNVHCHYVGMNASAATIAAMGAKHITIDADALFLVHKCMSLVLEWDYMNADELAAHIAELEKQKKDNETIDGCIAGMYAKRCKKTKAELLDLMKEGAWLTAQQAKEWGFVDEITNDPEDAKPVLTDAEASVLADAGIPLPPINMKKGSILDRLFKFFSNKPVAQTAVADDVETTQNPTTPMAKTFAKLAALLGVTVAVADTGVTLTEAQADLIEGALAEHDSTVAELNAKLAEKEGKIAEQATQIA
ncbi:MAG: Clp protease ClpP, partial [Muribaculaceae bacterium]|nr:Clp protease ClpP [Muribaculaceae bacterium]